MVCLHLILFEYGDFYHALCILYYHAQVSNRWDIFIFNILNNNVIGLHKQKLIISLHLKANTIMMPIPRLPLLSDHSDIFPSHKQTIVEQQWNTKWFWYCEYYILHRSGLNLTSMNF